MPQTNASTEVEPETDFPMHPADVLLHLIVLLLAPLFLEAGGGNIAFARMAALETVNAYRARNNADLIAIAQIIAFGLAALGSLSLSMADGVSVSMSLRLRGNANALNRSAEQNRRALQQPLRELSLDRDEIPTVSPSPAVTRASSVTAPTTAKTTERPVVPAQPTAAQPTPAQPTATQPTNHERQAAWAAVMADVAAEVAETLPNLSPEERRRASIQTAALSSAAKELLHGNVPSSGLSQPRAA